MRSAHEWLEVRRVLFRSDVDVGSALARALGDDAVDQADDRRVILAFEQVGGGRDVLDQGIEAAVHVELVDRVAGVDAGIGVDLRPPAVERTVRQALDVESSEEHTSELQSLLRISYAVFFSNKKNFRLLSPS